MNKNVTDAIYLIDKLMLGVYFQKEIRIGLQVSNLNDIFNVNPNHIGLKYSLVILGERGSSHISFLLIRNGMFFLTCLLKKCTFWRWEKSVLWGGQVRKCFT